jgi:predicted DNA-binding protein
VSERRKQAVSIRMSAGDVRKIKKLAARLGVHDSDIVRFAVKSMLSRLEPLHDADARGRSVLPVFVESGDELVRFFELDALRLDIIINEGVDQTRRVDRDDVALIAMHAMQPPYAAVKLSEIAPGAPDANGNMVHSLRRYLYEKYARKTSTEAGAKT